MKPDSGIANPPRFPLEHAGMFPVAAPTRRAFPHRARQLFSIAAAAGLALGLLGAAALRAAPPEMAEVEPGVAYANDRIRSKPWSIHIARVEREPSRFTVITTHANGAAVGLTTLSEQIKSVSPKDGRPVAGVNGDFYLRDRSPYAGDPRGLQIVSGEVISAPNGGVCFWMDPAGEPHSAHVVSKFKVTWPDGRTTPVGLNEPLRGGGAVLYSPALGASTRYTNGLELVLAKVDGEPWLPLTIGREFSGRVRQVNPAGNSPLTPEVMVLSLGRQLSGLASAVKPGDVLKISTASSPDLAGVQFAIGGGPRLVEKGRALKQKMPEDGHGALAYELRSIFERHPRSAIGWNKKYFYLIEVDGRQKNLSIGMTLDELGEYLAKLGCDEVMSLDGGGSAMFWVNGRIANKPCDGWERAVANAVVVVRKEKEPAP